MIAAKKHDKEQERILDLKSYAILDTLPEAEYDYITEIISEICETPISLISLIDDKRQWFKSHHGLDATETPKEYAFCAHAINDQDNILIVEDTRKDERFYDNPFVTGEPRVIFYAGIPLISAAGLPLGTLCVIDHTPKKLNQKQVRSLKAFAKHITNLLTLRKEKIALEQSFTNLEDKYKEFQQFAYLASHDLKQPLSTINNYIGLLEENSRDSQSEIEKTSFEYIQKSSVRMKELITSLLDNSRLGKNVKIAEVDCNKVVKDVIEDLSILIKKSKAKIDIGNLPVLYAFKTELRLLFQNLITNAIKFTADNTIPYVSIRSKKENSKWKFMIKDNGIGIDPKNKEKIFSMFKRLNSREEYEGSGMGLAHCKKIIELHKGKIWVDSKLGFGSAFQFTINENIPD